MRKACANNRISLDAENLLILCNSCPALGAHLNAPSQCIAVTARTDAHTPVYYRKGKDDRCQIDAQKYCSDKQPACITLDALVRYPDTVERVEGHLVAAQMNEVGILSCAQNNKGEVFRPKIVGVLWREKMRNRQSDHGNARRNVKLQEAAKNFARKNGLPFLTLEDSLTIGFSEEDFQKVQDEFSALPTSGKPKGIDLVEYHNIAGAHHLDPRNLILLNDEQLATYGLRR
jgi:hypothetical protein